MGFSFRKSKKFGPFRLNFSKSGVGASVGIKGARISTGSRGTYINFSNNGFSYKQRLDSSTRQNKKQNNTIFESENSQSKNINSQFGKKYFVDITNNDLVNEINSKIEKTSLFLTGIICSIAVFFGICILVIAIGKNNPDFIDRNAFSTYSPIFLILIFLLGVIFNWKLYVVDKRERTTVISYELKDSALKRFNGIKNSFEILSKSASIWRLKSFTNDRNEPLDVLKEQPPYISTDVTIWSLDSNYISFYFLPDYIFVWHNKKYGVVSYDSINVAFSTNTYVSTGNTPKDSTIVDYVFQHTRKDGNPDRRYKYNPSFPLVKYGILEIKALNGWSILLQVSNISAASSFADTFNQQVLNKQTNKNTNKDYQTNTNSYQKNANYNQWDSDPKTPTVGEIVKLAHGVLEIKVGATREQIIAAYREQVRNYHPDKVVQFSPKIAELAEEKMKQINAAYETLKKHNYV